jgi:hypothetical protein
MSTTTEMAEFVDLWGRVEDFCFTDTPDEIQWRWAASGEYSAKSAYSIQFEGSYYSFDSQAIWKAPMEGKHKLFAWLLVQLIQSKILITDKMVSKNWPCNQFCTLCLNAQETTVHLSLHCLFALQVWYLIRMGSDGLIKSPSPDICIEDWWRTSLTGLPEVQRRAKAAMLIYTTWNMWKERNRRIFEERNRCPVEVLHL